MYIYIQTNLIIITKQNIQPPMSSHTIQNIDDYHQHLKLSIPQISTSPNPHHKCTDKCCYVVFILLTMLLIGGGVYIIAKTDMKKYIQISPGTSTSTAFSSQFPWKNVFDKTNIKHGVVIISVMVLLSLVLSIAFHCLLIRFPQCMFYTMLILGGVLMIALIVIMALAGSIIAAAVFGIVVFIYCLLICFSYSKMKIGTILLYSAAKFIIQKPSVFFIPFIMLFLIIVFEMFWLVSLIAIGSFSGDSVTQHENSIREVLTPIFAISWVVLQIFYSVFFYYCTVFLIATATAFWYYNIQRNFVCTGWKRIFSHIGSFTQATFALIIVSLTSKEQGGVGCLCILSCCIKGARELITVLNYNSIITMAVTGQDFIDSAKSALSLIYNNLELFTNIDVVSRLLKFAGVLFISGIPGIAGYFLLIATSQNHDDKKFFVYGTLVIVLMSMLIAAIFLNTLSQALNSLFIFYCLDLKLKQVRSQAPLNVPSPMRKILEQLATLGNVPQPQYPKPQHHQYHQFQPTTSNPRRISMQIPSTGVSNPKPFTYDKELKHQNQSQKQKKSQN